MKLTAIQLYLLAMVSAQTHPNVELREFALNADPTEVQSHIDELIRQGYLKKINGIVSLTQMGLASLPKPQPEIAEFIQQLKRILPKNPKFGVIVESLTDSALVGLVHEIFGEIGRRGNPDNSAAVEFWQSKINTFQEVLSNATPDTLWERHQNQIQQFPATPVLKKGKK